MAIDPSDIRPADRFELVGAVRDAINDYRKVKSADREALATSFGIPVQQGRDWIDDLLAADISNVIELAKYLEVPLPDALIEGTSSEESVDTSATAIDAYEELVSAETALRAVIRTAVPNWAADFGNDAIAKLTAKRSEEETRRDGITVSQDLLDYTELYQLQQIINTHWEAVKPILDDKKRTDVYFGIISDVRNSISHSRPVFAAERLLLAGAAGQIRNQLAVYRSKADGPSAHYASIDSARDSGGREGLRSPELVYVSNTALGNIPRLDVGDTITFELEGTDPRGRELWWRACSVPSRTPPSKFKEFAQIEEDPSGDRAIIKWTVKESDVGEYRQIVIALASTGKYRRHEGWDDAVLFHYHVNPPHDV